jgi:hypothetical protein
MLGQAALRSSASSFTALTETPKGVDRVETLVDRHSNLPGQVIQSTLTPTLTLTLTLAPTLAPTHPIPSTHSSPREMLNISCLWF